MWIVERIDRETEILGEFDLVTSRTDQEYKESTKRRRCDKDNEEYIFDECK
jgi:hypothetical protein